MHHSGLISFSVIAFLIVLATYLSRFSKIPIAVVEILIGTIAAHFGLFESNETIKIVAHVSFLFLMFLAGMEVDLRGFSKLGVSFYKKALLYFVCLYLLAFFIVLVFKLEWIYIAIFPVMSLYFMKK